MVKEEKLLLLRGDNNIIALTHESQEIHGLKKGDPCCLGERME